MDKFPIISGKRFWDFALCDLIDLFSYPVSKYSLELRDDPGAIADAVIRDIRYPFHLGQPDDSHTWNSFHGSYKFCYTNPFDFWQKASETAFLKVGDCEDSSILGTALTGRLVGVEGVYEILGLVKDLNGQILGGHGWYIYRFDGRWHLVESTLDTPPNEYPIVTDYRSPFILGDIVYEPEILFNWERYIEISSIAEYMAISFPFKESRRKYEAISQSWKRKAKPLGKLNLLSKLRWVK